MCMDARQVCPCLPFKCLLQHVHPWLPMKGLMQMAATDVIFSAVTFSESVQF